MVSKLHYDPKYDTAMRYLFGKTLICRHLDAATKLSRSTGLDCVTLDGQNCIDCCAFCKEFKPN